MDDRDKPVPVLPDIEDHISIYIIGVLEPATDLREIVPPDRFDNADPSSDLVRRIRVPSDGLIQMPACHDMHFSNILHKL